MKLLCSLVILVLMVARTKSQTKIIVTVYYESKCPDSRRFIVNQLMPTIDKLGNYIHLQLIPFGKAWRGNGKFHCQHGDSECRGNMVQDCAISMMSPRSDAEILKYVACEMQTLAGTTGDLQCVRQAHLPVGQVKTCMTSRLGIDLQMKSMHFTESVGPTFIPTVTVNGFKILKMQANYPKKQDRRNWDPVHITYPVWQFPSTGESSETVARYWRDQPEVLKSLREPIDELKSYLRDYNITKELNRSQTFKDFEFKLPGKERQSKPASCLHNEYCNNPQRRLADRVPALHAHGTTEMREKLKKPAIPSRLVTDKDQHKHPHSLGMNPAPEPSWHKEIEPLDTTHDGFEKYLDPYLTTSRLHHRPFTADQLQKISNSKDVVTYYTFANISWAWGPKPKVNEWRLPMSRPNSVYDREKFKYEFKEVRTHNKLNWVPGTFRTEARENYVQPTSFPQAQIHNFDEEVRTAYKRALAGLQTNEQQEHSTVKGKYAAESTHIGSAKQICAVIDQFKEKNKRMEARNNKTR